MAQCKWTVTSFPKCFGFEAPALLKLLNKIFLELLLMCLEQGHG